MTARMIRSVRAADGDAALEAAAAELEESRSTARALRQLVAEGKAAKGSLQVAEYRIHVALRRLDELRGWQPPSEPGRPGTDDFDDAA